MAKNSFLSVIVFLLLCLLPAYTCLADPNSELAQIQTLLKQGRYDQAQTACRKIVADEPNSIFALKAQTQLASLLVWVDKDKEAENVVDKLLADFDSNFLLPQSLSIIARNYEWTYKFEQAKAIYNRIIKQFPDHPYAARARMDVRKADTFSFMLRGLSASAVGDADRLAADFPGQPYLPAAMSAIAAALENNAKFTQAQEVYRKVADVTAGTPAAKDVQLDVGRMDLLLSIDKAKDPNAAIDKYINDFYGQARMPQSLFALARDLEQLSRFSQAKFVNDRMIERFSNSPEAAEAKTNSAKDGFLILLKAEKYELAYAVAEKFVTDFKDGCDLDILGELIDRCKNLKQFDIADIFSKRVYVVTHFMSKSQIAGLWLEATEKSMAGDEAAAIAAYYRMRRNIEFYERSMGSFAKTASVKGDKSESETAKLHSLSRMKDANEVIAEVEKFISQGGYDPNLPKLLYLAAGSFEARPELDSAARIYRYVVEKFPYSPQADDAKVDAAKDDIMASIMTGGVTDVNAMLDKFIADFRGNSRLPAALMQIGRRYSTEGRIAESNEPSAVARPYQKAIKVFERIIIQFPDVNCLPDAYYTGADCFMRLGRNIEGVKWYEKIVENWPDWRAAAYAQYRVGMYYETICQSQASPDPNASMKMEIAYRRVVDRYPECPWAPAVSLTLGQSYEKHEQWQDAAKYLAFYADRVPEACPAMGLYYDIGQAYEKADNMEAAMGNYRKFIETTPVISRKIRSLKARLPELEGVHAIVKAPEPGPSENERFIVERGSAGQNESQGPLVTGIDALGLFKVVAPEYAYNIAMTGRYGPLSPAGPGITRSNLMPQEPLRTYIFSGQRDAETRKLALATLRVGVFENREKAILGLERIHAGTAITELGDKAFYSASSDTKGTAVTFRRKNAVLGLEIGVPSEQAIAIARKMDDMLEHDERFVKRAEKIVVPHIELVNMPETVAPGKTVECQIELTGANWNESIFGQGRNMIDSVQVIREGDAKPRLAYHCPKDLHGATYRRIEVLVINGENVVGTKEYLIKVQNE